MKLRLFPLLSLLVAVSLLVQGATLPAAAGPEQDTAEPAAASSFSCDSVTEIPKTECEALVALYDCTDGPNWKNSSGWLATNTPCSWFGITCASGKVTQIDLDSNNLRGGIPVALGTLAGLTNLRLSNNQLSGSIPTELGNLRNLTSLGLHQNHLTGSVPVEIGNLKNLAGLYLWSNELTGGIPPQLGNLSNLEAIALGGNHLTGNIPPELGNLSKLFSLQIQMNEFSGSIPPEIANLTNLSYLFLGWNQLSGVIPSELGNLSKLISLSLEGNQLSGEIPSELGRLSNLSWLLLDSNQLSGHIPSQLGGLVKLQRLSLVSNHLTGPIPSQLGSLTQLQYLQLRANALEGEIPASIVNLVNLGSGQENGLGLGYNKLASSDPVVVAFLDSKDPYWALTQTVPPNTVQATAGRVNSVELTWTPILYTGDGGYYEVGYSTTPGGPYNVHGRTANKSASSYVVSSLQPGKTYYLALRTYTPAHGSQQNNLLSGWSQEVSATTLSPTVSHIEIAQGTQDQNNSVSLIASRSAHVRVYLDCGPGCAAMPGVTGVLHGYRSAKELPGSPVRSINYSVTAYHEGWQTQRGDLSKTLNFTLPAEWLTGTITVTAEVAGATRSEGLTFRPAQSLNAIYVPIRYKGQEPDPTRVQYGAFWASRIYPTGKINYVAGTTFDWNTCLEDSILCPFRDLNTRNLLNELTTRYRLVNAYVYGWLPAGTYGGGISDPTWGGGVGKAAFGDDHPSEGQRVFAHEVGHLLGRRHTNSSSCQPENIDPQSDWPYADSLIQEYGLDTYGFGWLVSSSSAIVTPADTYDYMSYCGSLANGDVWTSPWTYQHIYDEALKPAVAVQALGQISTPETYFIASGLVFTDSTAALNPAWVVTATVTPSNPPVGTAYCLEAQDAASTALVSHCFDLTFRNYETGKAINVDGFNLMLPYPPGMTRVVLKQGATELAAQPVSAHAPDVDVISPNGGEFWAASGTYTITWTASDLDGDPLTYRVLYSPDGDNWVPVGTAITTTQLAVNAAQLAGGTAARVRVLATDGVNTSSDESDAAFNVGSKGPSVFILAPTGDVRFMPGTPLWLKGHGYDLEDGTLEGAALHWRSDRDGDLANGSQALVTLSPGRHTITLTATDSQGNTAVASMSIFAGQRSHLPLIMR